MKKKRVSFSKLYLVIVMLITYLPIAMVVVFSFNDSKLPVAWKGFTWKWYQELFHELRYGSSDRNIRRHRYGPG